MSNTGQIIKSKTTERFTVIPNAIARSKELTIEEKGLLSYLLSLPVDWVLYKRILYESLPDSKGTIDRVFSLLQEKGFIASVRVINERGQFIGWNHIVYDEAAAETPKPANAEVGQSAPILKTELITKKESISSQGVLVDAYPFDSFWNDLNYKKGDKEKLRKKWDKLSDTEKEKIKKHIPIYVSSTPDKKYRRHPETYLNKRTWLDEETGNGEYRTSDSSNDERQKAIGEAPDYDEILPYRHKPELPF